jgi:hypothetical protein
MSRGLTKCSPRRQSFRRAEYGKARPNGFFKEGILSIDPRGSAAGNERSTNNTSGTGIGESGNTAQPESVKSSSASAAFDRQEKNRKKPPRRNRKLPCRSA